MSNLMSGAKMLLECLGREGVDCFFGYPGGVTLPFYDALYDHHIRHVLVRHEENACFAAEGYARSTGKVGVCCATSGPGATDPGDGLIGACVAAGPNLAPLSAQLAGLSTSCTPLANFPGLFPAASSAVAPATTGVAMLVPLSRR